MRNRGSRTRLPEPYECGRERNEGALGSPTTLGRYCSELLWNSFLDLAVRRLSSWAALECRAEGSDCAQSHKLASESAVHVVTVVPASGNRAVRMSKGRR